MAGEAVDGADVGRLEALAGLEQARLAFDMTTAAATAVATAATATTTSLSKGNIPATTAAIITTAVVAP